MASPRRVPEYFLTNPEMPPGWESLVADRFRIQDDVHGAVYLTQLERDIVDAPEFQRLFRISQMGFVDYVFPTATHTRALHSIGTCWQAKVLVDILAANTPPLHPGRPVLSACESLVISTAALLHDVSHLPFSHDLETKTHWIPKKPVHEREGLPAGRLEHAKIRSCSGAFPKHDDYLRNPSLFVFLFNRDLSVLARVLATYSPLFLDLVRAEGTHFPALEELARYIDAEQLSPSEVLPRLIFQTLTLEDPLPGFLDPDDPTPRGLASDRLRVATSLPPDVAAVDWPDEHWLPVHRLWFQPFHHQVVGNTLNADLLDYLRRDLRRFGLHEGTDFRFLDYFQLVPLQRGRINGVEILRSQTAVNVWDSKRGTVRPEIISDLLRMLDGRTKVHEAAVFHRITQGATAMVNRACQLLPSRERPTVSELYGLESQQQPRVSLAADDWLLERLSRAPALTADTPEYRGARRLAAKVADRRIYRPLLLIPGDRMLRFVAQHMEQFGAGLIAEKEPVLRAAAATIDSTRSAPFLNIVCRLVQERLTHTIAGLPKCAEASRRVARRFRRTAEAGIAGELQWDGVHGTRPPERVILWAMPYKQLYKDPRLIIKFGAQDTECASLEEAGVPGCTPPSVSTLIADGLRALDSKYQASWKLLVLISDGLYSTGVLPRLLGQEHTVEQHVGCLREAQKICLAGLRVAFDVWIARFDGLNAPPESAEVEGALERFATALETEGLTQADPRPEEVSPLNLAAYAHGKDRGRDDDLARVRSTCRDITSRFGAGPELACAGELLHDLEWLFRIVPGRPTSFDVRDLEEIQERLNPRKERLIELVTTEAARERRLSSDELQREWMGNGPWGETA